MLLIRFLELRHYFFFFFFIFKLGTFKFIFLFLFLLCLVCFILIIVCRGWKIVYDYSYVFLGHFGLSHGLVSSYLHMHIKRSTKCLNEFVF
jgi:hypothetical protein